MSMICPECGSNTLEITQSLDLPPDGRNDEIILQVVQCGACKFHGLAVYGESRRGALDSDSWEHEGYRVDEQNFQVVVNAIRQCPKPGDRRCQCSTHQSYGQPTENRWDGLTKNGIKILGYFDIKIEN